MIFSGSGTRILCSFLIFVSVFRSALGQNDTITTVQADTTAEFPRHSGFIAGGYGNNLIYLGSTISGDQPFFYGSLIYSYNGELYASISTFHLVENTPFLPVFTESLSYNHVINSWFDYALSVAGYHSARTRADTLFSSFIYGDITVGIDWRLIYSKLSAGFMHSDENSVYFQFRNSHYFETPDFAKGKLNISFDPYVNTILGCYDTEEKETVSSAVQGRSYLKTGLLKKKTTTYSTSFGLLEIDFGLPVSLNGNRFTLETEAGYVLPVNTDPGMPDIKGFTFSISCFLKLL